MQHLCKGIDFLCMCAGLKAGIEPPEPITERWLMDFLPEPEAPETDDIEIDKALQESDFVIVG